jgi:hypothetical protein
MHSSALGRMNIGTYGKTRDSIDEAFLQIPNLGTVPLLAYLCQAPALARIIRTKLHFPSRNILPNHYQALPTYLLSHLVFELDEEPYETIDPKWPSNLSLVYVFFSGGWGGQARWPLPRRCFKIRVLGSNVWFTDAQTGPGHRPSYRPRYVSSTPV